jgi:hypothetical protein
MTKVVKPGQFVSIDGQVYRTKKRVDKCKGCDLDNILLCPCVIDSRNGEKPIDCEASNIIIKRL